jgi:hypothetical protein
MPYVDLTANVWTPVVTTTAPTTVQNRSARVIYIATEDTTLLPLDEGWELSPADAITFGVGVSVEASSIGAAGVLYYGEISE